MTRHEIEEAIIHVKQFVSQFRGIESLVIICETALNATKMVDGLDEKKTILEADITRLEQERVDAIKKQDKFYQTEFNDHTQRMEKLQHEFKLLQHNFGDLEKSYQVKQRELEAVQTERLREHAAWMEDYRKKEIVANENLTSIKSQYEQIRARFA